MTQINEERRARETRLNVRAEPLSGSPVKLQPESYTLRILEESSASQSLIQDAGSPKKGADLPADCRRAPLPELTETVEQEEEADASQALADGDQPTNCQREALPEYKGEVTMIAQQEDAVTPVALPRPDPAKYQTVQHVRRATDVSPSKTTLLYNPVLSSSKKPSVSPSHARSKPALESNYKLV